MLARHRALGAALLSLLLAAGLLVGVSAPAQAAGTQVYGRVTDARTGASIKTVRVLLFSSSWTYIRKVKVGRSGIYQIQTPGPGSYHLQFVDGRPAYRTTAYAAKLDVPVRVGTRPAQRNVRLKVGGAIGGVVKVRGKRAPMAQVRAVSNGGQVIEVTANKRGEYALGGLAKDDYRVSAYDAKSRRVGKSRLVRKVRLGTFRKASFNLRTRPGWIRGFLTLDGSRARGTTFVTAVNRRSGEYWVKKVRNGNISLKGLTPGSYQLKVPDVNGYFGGTFNIGRVRAGGMRNATVNLRTRGGTISGQAYDAVGKYGIPNISVRLTDVNGRTLDEHPASQSGTFRIGGTTRPQRVKITILAYSTIKGHRYFTYTGEAVLRNNANLDLGRIVMKRAS